MFSIFKKKKKVMIFIDGSNLYHVLLRNCGRSDLMFSSFGVCVSRNLVHAAVFLFFSLFVIAGFWHGPSWMYGFFGLLHGLGLATNHIFNKGYQLYPPGILQLLNIKYIVLSNNNFSHDNFSYLGKKDMTYFGNNSKYDGKNVKVDLFLFNKHYPRLFYSEKVEYLNSENIFDSILTDGYDPSERVYVSEEIISLIDNDLNKSVDLLYWSPNKIEFNTRCQSDQFLVISEIFYPNDWNLIMDNNKHKIYEVNNLVRGLIVPEGDHHFIMEFDSKSFNYGFKLSYLFFYLLLILLLSTIHIFRFKKDV